MKKYSVSTQFVFTGTFEVLADSKEEAKEFIEKHCGLVLGGNIHSTLPDDEIDWTFSTHPDTKIGQVIDLNKNDFKNLLTADYLEDMAEAHIEAWKDRYTRKSTKDIKFDLAVNHDDSLEVEKVEEDLKRELTDNERTTLIRKFHAAVVKQIRK